MKSIKPGRGPSAMGAAGSIFAVIFGIFWTIMAFVITQDSPFPVVGIIFPAFGLLFIGMGIAQAVYHYKNATGKERMSLFDITDSREEGDPLHRHFSSTSSESKQNTGRFCPYCGEPVEAEYRFCPKCGKSVPSSG
ncbi:zinc ribbon domain-containing protein [Brevibacillus borstelensis]|uniref:zinc ribbon domain-containing protein n=1 Tax=Brevibacillus borstelensis TaxID=45462 RepID=UPI0015628CFA|nr:zinc ribbon domain-containing protein [Brevibacillus borstelensis]MBE5396694.1 zinc ribbon domain-containing protein [Brevibacillus borstelensis]MED1743369.1 zinc ribbon domain-containing protein [Brevibacillus borstelensis]MED1874110.1 zinc ribbon domain-containing protein [Brevibacillus borstelensis]MED1885389.1 zinc ribbon domain-containing protein [Brevibacillus borstelensis]MED2007688.1 zinc ribbon domain-containing protein [Brevibacillus borstelensis]